MAAMWTLLAVVNLGRSSWWTPVNGVLLAAVYWTFGLVGLVVSHRRPDLARSPRRPSMALARTSIVTAAVAVLGGVVGLEVLVPDRTGIGLAWFAAGAGACAVLGVTAHRFNARAQAGGRFAHVKIGPGQPA